MIILCVRAMNFIEKELLAQKNLLYAAKACVMNSVKLLYKNNFRPHSTYLNSFFGRHGIQLIIYSEKVITIFNREIKRNSEVDIKLN